MHRFLHAPSIFFVTVVAASVAAATRTPAQSLHAPSRHAAHRVLRADTARLYTEQQATEGQAVFTKSCAECHESKDVNGADFKTKWSGRPVFALFEQIRTTMPDGNPGTLPRDDYVAAVAYILKLNGLPPGETRLASDSAALSAITLTLPPG
jgi:mono/diheme cytochrome c family protein